MTFVYTEDLARYLAEAVDLPDEANGARIDIGWDRPHSMRTLRDAIAGLRRAPLGLTAIPWWLLGSVLFVMGRFSRSLRDLRAMFAFMQTGAYVADTTQMARWFEVARTEAALTRWLAAKVTAAGRSSRR